MLDKIYIIRFTCEMCISVCIPLYYILFDFHSLNSIHSDAHFCSLLFYSVVYYYSFIPPQKYSNVNMEHALSVCVYLLDSP